jgi:hypothetical protein
MKLKDIIKDLKLGKIYTDKDRPPFKVNEGKEVQSFNKIIALLRNESKRLNDDDAHKLSTNLKAWFNKNVM